MDVMEAVSKRRSIRAFKSDPVPEDILRKIVDSALRAPSASNSQPWEFAIVSGTKLEEIKQAFVANADKPVALDMPSAVQYPEPWASRRSAVMAGALEKLGITREDKAMRMQWTLQGYRLWGAPNVIYLMIERSFFYIGNGINVWPVFDCGSITQTILLLATEYGLGCIPAIQPVLYPDILRKMLGLPESKLIVLGIPIGYPDENASINQLRTTREPIDNVAKFY